MKTILKTYFCFFAIILSINAFSQITPLLDEFHLVLSKTSISYGDTIDIKLQNGAEARALSRRISRAQSLIIRDLFLGRSYSELTAIIPGGTRFPLTDIGTVSFTRFPPGDQHKGEYGTIHLTVNKKGPLPQGSSTLYIRFNNSNNVVLTILNTPQ